MQEGNQETSEEEKRHHKSGLTVTEGKGMEVDRWERRKMSGGAGANVHITFGMHKAEGGHGEGRTTQRRQQGILQHLNMLMDSDCNEVSGGISLWGQFTKLHETHVDED